MGHNKFRRLPYKISLACIIFLVSSCASKEPYVGLRKEGGPSKTVEQILASTDEPEQRQQIASGIQALWNRDYQGASQTFNEALSGDPTNAGVHTLNGLAYQMMGKSGNFSSYDLAEAGYLQAKKFDPNNTFAALQLGRIKAEKKDYMGAQEEFAEVLLLDPTNQTALYELASVSYLAGDIKTARMCVDQLLQKNKTKAEYARAGALIYSTQGDREGAQLLLGTYKKLEKDPKQTVYLEQRVNDWFQLHKAKKITLAQATTTSPIDQGTETILAQSGTSGGGGTSGTGTPSNPETPDIPLVRLPSQTSSATGGTTSGGQQNQTSAGGNQAPAHNQESPPKPAHGAIVVIDAVVLRVQDEGSTSKGNNILQNFTLTLAPFTRYFAGNAGGAITGANIFPLNNISTNGSTLSGVVSSIVPGLRNQVSLFTSAISFGTLNYALNIANATTQHVEVIGRPTLTGCIGKTSEFFSGEELKIALTGTFGGGRVEKSPSGISLKITPLQLENDIVTLDIEIIDSFLEDTEQEIVARALALVPLVFNLNSSSVKTTVRARLGETIMLAGSIRRFEIHSNTGVPLLKDIPLVQYLFSNESKSSENATVLYLMTPRSHQDVRETVKKFCLTREQEVAKRPNLMELESRHENWFSPQTSIVPILRSVSPLYHDFRYGDFVSLYWHKPANFVQEVTKASNFLWY